MKLPPILIAAVLALAASTRLPAQAPQYVVTPMSGFDSRGINYFDINGINNSGQVSITGGYFDGSGMGHGSAYRWEAGTTTYLGSLGGNTGVGGINNKGEVVGSSNNSVGIDHAFLWSNGTMQDLVRDYSYGYAVNYGGQVAGTAYFSGFSNAYRAALYSGGTWQNLGTLGGNTSAGYAINTSGQVAGRADTSAANTHHAFVYSGGSRTDLGTLGGTNSEARGINDAGILVGNAQVANGETHAFIYYGGAMRDLGTLGGTSSSATAINQAGLIVGNLDSAGFLKSGGAMYNLDNITAVTQGVTNFYAASLGNAINDWGQIAAYGYNQNGVQQAVILTPRAMGTAFSGGLGDLAGGTFSSGAQGVSNGGGVVVGYGSNSLATPTAFRWSLNGGIVDFANNSSDRGAASLGVSADGSTVVGYDNNAGVQGAFRYTSGSGLVQLGNISGGTASYAIATSSDGAVVVGRADSAAGVQPFRWTQSGGMVGLGWLAGAGSLNATAYGVSGDGTVVVGYSKSASSGSNNEAFRWTQSGGMVGLGDLAGGTFNSTANGVSSNGSVIVGQGTTASGSEAFRWTQAGGMVSLGDLAGGTTNASANGVSGNGQIVVGQGTDAVGAKAFVWDAKHGMRDLQSVLSSEYGVNFAGWTLTDAKAISANGDAVAGQGIDSLGNTQAWSAQINSLTNRFVSGESYGGFHTSMLGGNGTFMDMLDGSAGGTAGTFRTVTAAYGTTSSTTGLASDLLNFTGTGTDNFVLRLSYDEALALPLGGESAMKLDWLDPGDSQWKNAVVGNTGGTAFFAGDGAYNSALDFHLGYYGVDTVNNEVWAVLNHNSSFGVSNIGSVPEPGCALLLVTGGAGLLMRRRAGGAG